MLRAQGKYNRIVRGSCLQFKVEGAAKPLPQRQTPSPVDPISERRMDHQLHATGLVKEPFQHEFALGRNHPQAAERCREIIR